MVQISFIFLQGRFYNDLKLVAVCYSQCKNKRVLRVTLLRHVLIPFLLLGAVCLFFFETAKRFPVYFLGAAGVLIVFAMFAARSRKIRDEKRSWRVGHVGRDAMYYEELRNGTWDRIDIDGEMLVGKAHHIIYFASTKFPDWAFGRREEIVERIKSEFRPPEYEYDDV
jgi:hypothetical protein